MSTDKLLKKLRGEISGLKRGPGRRYPRALVQAATGYLRMRAQAGDTPAKSATVLGVPAKTVVRWLEQGELTPTVPAGRLRRIRVGSPGERLVDLFEAPTSAAVVSGPAGVTVRGLDVSQIAQLLRELSCS